MSKRKAFRNGKATFWLIALLLVVSFAAAMAHQQLAPPPAQQANPNGLKGVAGLVGAGADENDAQPYAADPGKVGATGESAQLSSIEDYWYTRVSYPTGKYDNKWLLQAAQQDAAVQKQVPAGQVTYRPGDAAMSMDPNSWTSLGPQPEQSDGCSGCYSYGHVSGRVNDIRIDPVNPTVAYLAPVGGGVWKTTNCCTASTTWTAVTDSPLVSTVQIDDLTIDPSNHNTVYVGTGDLNFGSFSMGSAGILKTTDAGSTWSVKGADVFTGYFPQPAGQFPQYQAVGKVEVDPRNSNTIVAGTKTGVFFSYDGGDNWTGPCMPDNYATQRQDITGLILHDNGTFSDMYVAVGTRGYSTTVQYSLAENGANGIYKSQVPSTGCPASWTLSSRPDNGWPAGTGTGTPYHSGGDPLGRIDLAIAPSNPNYVYAIVQSIATPGGVLGVWRTTDGGTTWTQRTTVSGFSTSCSGAPGTQNWYNQHIAVDPNNPDVVLADTIDIYKSTNGGTSFSNLTCGYAGGRIHVDQHAIEYMPGSSSVTLTGSDGGVYLSTNMDQTTPTFTPLNDSLSTIEFYSGDITANFATSSSPGINAGAQDNGSSVYVWPNNNVGPALWQLRNGGDGMYARIEPVLGQRWYQESQGGALRVSTTGPYGSLTSASGGWSADNPRVSFVFPYEIYKGNPSAPASQDCAPTGCTHMIAGSYRVWETIQGGIPTSSWYINSPDLTKNTLADRSFINQLSYSVSLSTTAIVGTNDGNVQYGFNLGQGTANSATWVNVTGGNTVLPNRPILDVATDPVNPLVGYAAVGGFDENTPSTPGHVYQVTCAANCATFTWANKSGNLPDIPVDSVIANPNFPQQVFAGSDWGFYYTNDITVASPTWYRFDTGMPNSMIWDMAIDRGNTTLALFTRGRGAYVWPLPSGPFGGATPTPGSPSPTTPPATPSRTATVPANTATATNTVAATATQTDTPLPTQTPGGPSATTVPSDTATPVSSSTPTTVATNTPGGPTPTACTLSFTDVPPNSTFYSYIHCLSCLGIINGYPDGSFRPNANVTRGQLSKIVANAAGFNDTPTGQQFQDVPPSGPGSTFYVYIFRLVSRGYISGYPCGGPGEPCVPPSSLPYFRPNANATRGQISKIVSNAAGFADPPIGQQFQDVPVGSTYYTYTYRLVSRGVMSGYPCGAPPAGPCVPPANLPYFRPNNNATRGQTSKIVANTFFPDCNIPAR